MNLKTAVLDCYGCLIPDIPPDGVMRTFPIDQFRMGFLISLGDRHSFGCWADGDIYYFDGEDWHGLKVKVGRPPKQEFNRMIIMCAQGLVERGDQLDAADMARLKLAVQQVEAAS